MKHRLMYVAGQLGGGGLERQLWYLLSVLDRDAYRPGVAVWDYDPDAVYARKLRELGVPLYPVERAGGFAARLARFRALVRSLRPEVLHSYSFPTNFPAWRAMQGLPGIAVGSLRNEYAAERAALGRVGGALCSRFPPFLIANNTAAKRAAEGHRSWTAPRRVAFIPNGLDLACYPATPLPAGERLEIVGVGRLSPQKQWQDALEALARFRDAARVPWRFRIFGNGPLLDELQALRERLGLAQQVEFPGFSDAVPATLAASHVLLLTSRFEGTPNVVLEAMASGRPVVATDVGDVSRLLRDGAEGFVVPPGDIAAMADRLGRIAADRELAARMGGAARARAEAEFSLETLRDRTLQAYCQAGWKP